MFALDSNAFGDFKSFGGKDAFAEAKASVVKLSDKNNSLKKAAISAAVGTAVDAALAVPPVLLFDYIVKRGRKFEIKDAFKKRPYRIFMSKQP